MKPIEGLDLVALAGQAEQDRQRDLEESTRRKIAIILGNHNAAKGSIVDLDRQMLKAKERLAKEQAKLEAIRRGDWSVLQDEKEKKEEEEKERQNQPVQQGGQK